MQRTASTSRVRVAKPSHVLLVVGLALATLGPAMPAAAEQSAAVCEFKLGFAGLRALIPDTVGDCLEDEYLNPRNGNAEQRTTGGLLVWRKYDNWTAFTDGFSTWLMGPYGLQMRLNTGPLFEWERIPASNGTLATPPPEPAVIVTPVASKPANLRGANLTGANRRGADLGYADLYQARLASADFTGAYLWGANLSLATMTRTIFTQANLTKADLTRAVATSATFTQAIIVQARLHGTDLRTADLRAADLRGADLSQANLVGANLMGANLTGALTVGANFKDAITGGCTGCP